MKVESLLVCGQRCNESEWWLKQKHARQRVYTCFYTGKWSHIFSDCRCQTLRIRLKGCDGRCRKEKRLFRGLDSMDFNSWMTKWICTTNWRNNELRCPMLLRYWPSIWSPQCDKWQYMLSVNDSLNVLKCHLTWLSNCRSWNKRNTLYKGKLS